MATTLPITERSNELTEDIDIVEGDEFLRIFRQSDGQLFSGWRQFLGLYDHEILDSLERLSQQISVILANQGGIVVFSGAGTSGRIAFFCSRAFNLLQQQGKQKVFEYLIAGGDKALFTAQELSEDDVNAAVTDLQSIEKRLTHQNGTTKNRIIYVGITCGLSAPYVAAQLEYAMNYNISNNGNSSIEYVPVLLGFSPVAFSRNVPIENWGSKTFFQIASRLDQLSKEKPNEYFVINPVVGPETVTGSTRMKGGSATKILIEALFIRAMSIHASTNQENSKEFSDNYSSVVRILQTYEQTYREAYLSITRSLWPAVRMCGDALSSKGKVHYLSEHSSFGLLSLIDASECPPTFGANIDDVKAYFQNSWNVIHNKDGNLMKYPVTIPATRFTASPEESRMFHIDLHDNPEMIVEVNDTVVFIHFQTNSLSDATIRLLRGVKEKGTKIALVFVTAYDHHQHSLGDTSTIFDYTFHVPLSHTSFHDQPFFAELALKYTLNALSTGAHVLKGKILKNRMIDVRVSNAKLFDRSLRIIAQFANTDEINARCCLLRSIYHTDVLTDEMISAPVSKHIECGFRQDKIVPRAILLATGKFNFEEALHVLNNQPIVRKVLLELEKHQ